MFRLAVADVETGILNINVSAISKHKYGRNLFATLNSFLHASPRRFVKEMVRLPESDERNECILYYSVLLHELRHFLDILITPYGAWRVRHAFECMITLPQMLSGDEAMIIPLEFAADPFYAKYELGIADPEGTTNYQFARLWKNHKKIIAADNQGFETENNRQMQFGGEAMLEALAFGVQADLVRLFVDDAVDLKRRFPSAFEELRGPDPTHIDVTYRWYAYFQNMIGTGASPGTAKLVSTAIFASLCGPYYPPGDLVVRTSLESEGDREPFDLTQNLPNALFQNIIGDLLNRFEGKIVDANLTWQQAWEIVDTSFKSEIGVSIFDAIEQDCEAMEAFLQVARTTMKDRAPALSRMLSDAIVWFDAHIQNRKRAVDVFRGRPHFLVDHLSQMDLYSGEIRVPVVLDYPTSTNKVVPLSKPVDEEIIELPKFLSEKIRGKNVGFWESLQNKVAPPSIHQKVYFSSFFMKGAPPEQQNEFDAWPKLVAFQVPFFKGMVYGDDPMDISGRTVQMVLENLQTQFPQKFHFIKSEAERIIVSSAENYMEFHDLETAQCDYCAGSAGTRFKKNELVSVSATVSRGMSSYDQLPSELSDLKRSIDARDWSENRVCETCFRRLFPQKPADKYFNAE